MSETFASTRDAVQRLRSAWDQADEDAKWSLGFWFCGVATMNIAIITQFGWLGAAFSLGWLLYSVGRQNLKG